MRLYASYLMQTRRHQVYSMYTNGKKVNRPSFFFLGQSYRNKIHFLKRLNVSTTQRIEWFYNNSMVRHVSNTFIGFVCLCVCVWCMSWLIFVNEIRIWIPFDRSLSLPDFKNDEKKEKKKKLNLTLTFDILMHSILLTLKVFHRCRWFLFDSMVVIPTYIHVVHVLITVNQSNIGKEKIKEEEHRLRLFVKSN